MKNDTQQLLLNLPYYMDKIREHTQFIEKHLEAVAKYIDAIDHPQHSPAMEAALKAVEEYMPKKPTSVK